MCGVGVGYACEHDGGGLKREINYGVSATACIPLLGGWVQLLNEYAKLVG